MKKIICNHNLCLLLNTANSVYILQHGRINHEKYKIDTIKQMAKHIFKIGSLKNFVRQVSARNSYGNAFQKIPIL